MTADYLGAFCLADGASPPPASEIESAAEVDDLVVALARRAGEVTAAALVPGPALERVLRGGSAAAERAFIARIEAALVPVAAAAMEAAALLGVLHVEQLAKAAGALELADDAPNENDPIVFEEAVDALRARVAHLPYEFAELADALRFRAFTAAATTVPRLLLELQTSLATALETGQTFASWMETGVRPGILSDPRVESRTPWYWETVFRTNLNAAHTAGRWSQIRSFGDDVVAIQYIAIEDTRTTAVCRSYAGLVRPADDPIWSAITPPNHFNCRSTLRPIFAGTEEAGTLAVTPAGELVSLPRPERGFEASPMDPAAFLEMPRAMKERVESLDSVSPTLRLGERIEAERQRALGGPTVRDRASLRVAMPERAVRSLNDLGAWFGDYRNELRATFQTSRASTFKKIEWQKMRGAGTGAETYRDGRIALTAQTEGDLVRALARGSIDTVGEADAVFTALHELGHLIGEDPTNAYLEVRPYHHAVEWANEAWTRAHFQRSLDAMGIRMNAAVAPAELVATGPYRDFCGRLDSLLEVSGLGPWSRDGLGERLNTLVDPEDFADEIASTVSQALGGQAVVTAVDVNVVLVAPTPGAVDQILDRVRQARRGR